jgi:hypothetical protein
MLTSQNQNKDVKDLMEMRLMQIFESSLNDNTKYVISVERLDNMPEFIQQYIKNKAHIPFPDK